MALLVSIPRGVICCRVCFPALVLSVGSVFVSILVGSDLLGICSTFRRFCVLLCVFLCFSLPSVFVRALFFICFGSRQSHRGTFIIFLKLDFARFQVLKNVILQTLKKGSKIILLNGKNNNFGVGIFHSSGACRRFLGLGSVPKLCACYHRRPACEVFRQRKRQRR